MASYIYEGVSRIFRTGRLEQKLQMVRLSANRFGRIAILLVILVGFAAITPCVASRWVLLFIVYFVLDSVPKLLVTHSYDTAQLPYTCFIECPPIMDTVDYNNNHNNKMETW